MTDEQAHARRIAAQLRMLEDNDDEQNRKYCIEWTGQDAIRRRLRFEKRSLGGWTRIEQRHNGEEWVRTGRETVADVEVTLDE